MEYDCFYNRELNAVEIATRGTAERTQLDNMLNRAAELCRQHESANLLIDHSQLDAGPLKVDEVRSLSWATVSLQDAFRHRKCAHIAVRDLQFGLVRAWESLSEIKGLTELDRMVFRSRDEAIAWLKSIP